MGLQIRKAVLAGAVSRYRRPKSDKLLGGGGRLHLLRLRRIPRIKAPLTPGLYRVQPASLHCHEYCQPYVRLDGSRPCGAGA